MAHPHRRRKVNKPGGAEKYNWGVRPNTNGGGGGGGGVPTFTTGWLFYYGVSTRHSRLLAAEAPPSRQQGGVEERCKLPNRGLGRSPRSFHTLRFKSR